MARKDLKKIKDEQISEAEYDFQKEKIEKDFSQFATLKQMFDETVAEFLGADILSKSLSLGEFFSWLWKKDCARYVALEQFLYANEANKYLSLRRLERLPLLDLKKSLIQTAKDEAKK